MKVFKRPNVKALGILQNAKGFTNAEIAECALVCAIVVIILIWTIIAFTEGQEVLAKINGELFR